MRVRLTRKYAEMIDGIDLSQHSVGDVMDLPVRDARILIAEGWAAPAARPHGRAIHPKRPPPDAVGDRTRRRRRRRR